MNAITKLTGGDIAPIDELEALIAAESQSDESAYDIIATRLHIAPGGTNNFVSTDGAMNFRQLSAIVAVSQKARAYWPTKATGQPPLCASNDGVTGLFNFAADNEHVTAATKTRTPHKAVTLMDAQGHAPEAYDCAACPMAQWNSAAVGKGQACKTLRRLILLIEGMAMPVVLTLPPTSVAAWDAYCSSLRQRKQEYFAVRTVFDLEKMKTPNGEPYSVVRLSVGSTLKLEDVRAVIEVRRQFETWVRGKSVGAEDYSEATPTEKPVVVEGVKEDIPF